MDTPSNENKKDHSPHQHSSSSSKDDSGGGGGSGGWAPAARRSNNNKPRNNRHHHHHRRPRRPSPPPTWLLELTPTATPDDAFKPFVLILMGFPGSGKSTIATKLQECMPYKYVRINQDELGNRKKCLARTKAVLEQGLCPVIDRCNAGLEHRKPFLQLAAAQQQYCPVDCLILEAPRHECVWRCKTRQDHPTVKPHQAEKVVGFMKADWKLPTASEKFRNVWRVDASTQHSQADNAELRRVLEHLVS